jgi:hypothetical protein
VVDHQQRESPENNYGSSTRRREKDSSRRYQSELALNSSKSQQDSPKLFNFDDDFGASSLPVESKNRNTSLSSPTQQQDDLIIVENINKPKSEVEENKTSSPFENDFFPSSKETVDDLLVIDEPIDIDTAQQKPIKEESQQKDGGDEIHNIGIPGNENGIDDTSSATTDTFPSELDNTKVFSFSGRRLESIKSEEEKSNDDNSHSQNSEGIVQMKKSDSFNIFKRADANDPFADDEFFT